MPRCRCGRIDDMGGDDRLIINGTTHTSLEYNGEAAFCGQTRSVDDELTKAENSRLRKAIGLYAKVRCDGCSEMLSLMAGLDGKPDTCDPADCDLSILLNAM